MSLIKYSKHYRIDANKLIQDKKEGIKLIQGKCFSITKLITKAYLKNNL